MVSKLKTDSNITIHYNDGAIYLDKDLSGEINIDKIHHTIEILLKPGLFNDEEQDAIYQDVCQTFPNYYPADEIFLVEDDPEFEEKLAHMSQNKMQEFLSGSLTEFDDQYMADLEKNIYYPSGTNGKIDMGGADFDFEPEVDESGYYGDSFDSEPDQDLEGLDPKAQNLLSAIYGNDDDLDDIPEYETGSEDSLPNDSFGGFSDSDLDTFSESFNESKWFLMEDMIPVNNDQIYFVTNEDEYGVGICNEDVHAVAMSDGLGVRYENIRQWTYLLERNVMGYPKDGDTIAIEMADLAVPALAMYVDKYLNEEDGNTYKAAILAPIYEFENTTEGNTVISWDLVEYWYALPETDALRALEGPLATKEDPEHQHLLTMDMIYKAAEDAKKAGMDLDSDVEGAFEGDLGDDIAEVEEAPVEDELSSALKALKDKSPKEWKPDFTDIDPDDLLTEERHTFRDFEGTMVLADREERDKVIAFINEHNQDFMNGQFDEAIAMENEYEAEDEAEADEYKRSVIIKGATDIDIYDLIANAEEELADALGVSIEDSDFDFTGYYYEG